MTKKRYTPRNRKYDRIRKACPMPPGGNKREHKLLEAAVDTTRPVVGGGNAWVWVCVGYAVVALVIVAWCLWYMMR